MKYKGILIEAEFKLSEARYIPYKTRKEAKDSDFVDPERRSFPILKAGDVKAAVHAWGRYKGSLSFSEFKSRLKAIAKRKGFENEIPKDWKDEEKK